MAISFDKEQKAGMAIVQAMKTGDDDKMAKAWADFHASIADQIMDDYAAVQTSNDSKILAQRGFRQLTSKETGFYQALIGALKSPNPQQAFISLIDSTSDNPASGTDTSGIMPETIIEDVYRNLQETHPLLSKVGMQYVGYSTKWVVNDATVTKATWGNITDAIAAEIKGAIKVIDVHQNKLSAYCFIEKGMLDLGPTFLDGYIRAILREALAAGLELAIVDGNGVDQPIGLNRDIHNGVTYNTSSGYPKKTSGQGLYTVTSFEPADYGALVSHLAKTEKGNNRNFQSVALVCNLVDYLTKVMPATTVKDANGEYVRDVFPFPTEVIISNACDTGEAIMFLPDEYKLFAGGQRGNVIEYSDDYKFVEDMRYFKVKQYATGRAFDNTSAILLDISNLEPLYMTVKVADGSTITTTVDGKVQTEPSA